MEPAGWEIPGGHKRQLLKTAAALSNLGVDVRAAPVSAAELRRADIVHGFGLQPESLRHARQSGCAVAISTIYVGAAYRTRPAFPAALSVIQSSARSSGGQLVREMRAMTGQPRGRLFRADAHRHALAFESADILLPNAQGEAKAIATELGVSTPRVVVPNAVDPSIFRAPDTEFTSRRGVVSVGRIEPHKNQLGLIRALAGTDIGLTIVGSPHPHHEGYFERCRRDAGPQVVFLGETRETDLPELLAGHRVHALPSAFETTGLASLEAALCGCSIVTTDQGWASEYFGNDAVYCSPWSLRAIRRAVLAVYDRPPDSGLRERIVREFSWEVTARMTLQAYELAMAWRQKP